MIELQTMWTWLPAIYLFLGGLGAGAFCTISVLRLAFPGRFKKTVTFGAWISVAALAIGLLSLVAEVAKPFQAMILFQSFVNPTSWMTIGAWLLFSAFAVVGLSAVFTTDKIAVWLGHAIKPLAKRRDGINKVLAIIGIPLALAVAVYTGILLGSAPGIPLWNTWVLPVLFTVSALDTGLAAVLIVTVMLEKDEGIGRVRRIFEGCTVGLIAIEAMVLGGFFSTMLGGTQSQAISAQVLLEGSLGTYFWVLVVGVGLVVPFVISLVQVISKRHADKAAMPALPITGAVCALVGGFMLRYLVLSAGIHAVLMSPEVVQAMNGITYFIS